MAYDLNEFRREPGFWDHDHDFTTAAFNTGSSFEYADILYLTEKGAVVLGHYGYPDEWKCGPVSPNGMSIYEVPWDNVRQILTTADAEVAMDCRAADDQLLSYAR